MAIFSADKDVNVISWDLINNMSRDSYLLFLQNDTNIYIYTNIFQHNKIYKVKHQRFFSSKTKTAFPNSILIQIYKSNY